MMECAYICGLNCPFCMAAIGEPETKCREECTIKKITGECQMKEEMEEFKHESI